MILVYPRQVGEWFGYVTPERAVGCELSRCRVLARVLLALVPCERCDGDGAGQACELDCQRAREGRRGRDNAQVRWGVMCTSGGALCGGARFCP